MQYRSQTVKAVRLTFMLVMLVFVTLLSVNAHADTNMIAYAKSKGTPRGTLVETKSGVRFRYANKTYAKDAWIEVDNQYYYFDEDGYSKPGWFEYSGNTYYASSEGTVLHDMWHKEGSKQFFLKANGVLAKAQWVVKNKRVFIVDKNGVMIKNKMFSVRGKYYYVNKNGQRVANTWVSIGGKRYFFNARGERLSAIWIRYRGNYYYVKSNGVMAVNEDVGKYHVNKSGVLSGFSSEYKKYATVKYLFVGDSRTVGMSMSVKDSKTAYIGKVGEGYNWMKSTADAKVKKYLSYNPKLNVIFGFGVNDLGNVQKYISYYKSMITAYPNAKFYIMAINPVNDKTIRSYYRRTTVNNTKIRDFNKKVYSALKSNYINTFYYLCKNGFDTVDGLHYTSATYKKIYNYVRAVVR